MRRRSGLIAISTAAAVIAVAGLKGKLRRYEIAEASMAPQLRAGDFIIAQARTGDLVRSDIVIIPHPEIAGFELIKRVVGLPGERITLANGQAHINGVVLAEPWADGPVRPDGEWELDDAQAFVLGDNRPVSAADSRTIGPVPTASIEWKAVARYWPPSRLGRISTRSSAR
jgi:signal peptidase I